MLFSVRILLFAVYISIYICVRFIFNTSSFEKTFLFSGEAHVFINFSFSGGFQKNITFMYIYIYAVV